jgi:triosephosphate isomerase
MARTIWVIGNWKQNLLREPAGRCAHAIAVGVQASRDSARLRVGVAPTYLALDAVRPHARPAGPLWLLAQDAAAQDSGAFTGEVGPAMLREAGVEGAILGHSERRAHFGDTDSLVSRKLRCALEGGLAAVLCVGEPLSSREAGTHEDTVARQLDAALAGLAPELCTERLIIAYEPVWAIGTGRVATPAQASAMHVHVRGWLHGQFGSAGSDRSILYGGSVKPDSAAGLLAAEGVDGFLVGGASLNPDTFLPIVAAAGAACSS